MSDVVGGIELVSIEPGFAVVGELPVISAAPRLTVMNLPELNNCLTRHGLYDDATAPLGNPIKVLKDTIPEMNSQTMLAYLKAFQQRYHRDYPREKSVAVTGLFSAVRYVGLFCQDTSRHTKTHHDVIDALVSAVEKICHDAPAQIPEEKQAHIASLIMLVWKFCKNNKITGCLREFTENMLVRQYGVVDDRGYGQLYSYALKEKIKNEDAQLLIRASNPDAQQEKMITGRLTKCLVDANILIPDHHEMGDPNPLSLATMNILRANDIRSSKSGLCDGLAAYVNEDIIDLNAEYPLPSVLYGLHAANA
jgi:hypothetical protein